MPVYAVGILQALLEKAQGLARMRGEGYFNFVILSSEMLKYCPFREHFRRWLKLSKNLFVLKQSCHLNNVGSLHHTSTDCTTRRSA